MLRIVVLGCVLLLVSGCGGGSSDSPTSVAPTPPTPADLDYAFQTLNAMRASEAPGAAPFVRDAGLDGYAANACAHYIQTGVGHGYYNSNPISAVCPTPIAPAGANTDAENQGIVGPGTSNTAGVDMVNAAFLAEKSLPQGHPDRGHYENIIDPGLNSVGIGMARAPDGRLIITWDFCD